MEHHAAHRYRWPSKLRKFGITDPCLMWVVAKYENEIPWQAQVRNQDDLAAHVAAAMWPRQRERMVYPPRSVKKSAFVSARHVDLELALTTDQELDRADIEIIRLIRDDDGPLAATAALVEVTNHRKRVAFEAWLNLLDRDYRKAPAFAFLLLRPLLDQAGAGARRTIIPPDPDVVAWLYRRVCEHRVTPNDNLAKVYTWKLGSGAQRVPQNGWQYIPPGPENAARLVAAASGSGWCVASYNWATGYLEHSCFYILRSAGRPVVALRASAVGDTIVECQGQNNFSPGDWFVDIELFLRSQEMELCSRTTERDQALVRFGDLAAYPESWWKERILYWPFAARLAPMSASTDAVRAGIDDMTPYMGFPRFHKLVATSGLSIGAADWAAMVAIDPARLAHVPEEYAHDEAVLGACRRGWIERVEDGDLTGEEIQRIPEFVRKSDDFAAVLRAHLPDQLRARIRRPPRTAAERLKRFDLDEVLPASDADPFRLAVERAVNRLLTNETCDFSDQCFPDAVRDRADFPQVREQAWKEAIQAQPPLWFALPNNLKDLPDFQRQTGTVTRVDLTAWEEKVHLSPWLLTQKSGVPKSVRLHERILEAYLSSWMGYLTKAPWRIWVKRGFHRRVYLSYGALADPRVLDALTNSWREKRGTLFSTWSKASNRMRRMSLYQVAVLRAVGAVKAQRMTSQELKTCLDILELHRGPRNGGDVVHSDEVRRRLIATTLLTKHAS